MKRLRIIVDINHPAHVHFFKNFIWEMEKIGHRVLVTASRKDIALELLDKYKIKYVNLGSYGDSLSQKVLNLLNMDYKMYRAAKKFNPDLLIGIASIRAAHTAFLLKKKCYIFDDTEKIPELNIYLPFTTKVYTPSCFKLNFGNKQVYYKGYHELSYLHPSRFKPNKDVLKELGLNIRDKFFIVRFVSWQAGHDIAGRGFSLEGKRKLIKELSKHGTVIITSEGKLPVELKKFYRKIPIEKIHDLIYFSTACISEGATMASEAAILGTPAFFVSSLTAGTLEEQEKIYGLVYRFNDENIAIKQIKKVIETKDLKNIFKKKRMIMLKDKIDVTDLMIKEVSLIKPLPHKDKVNNFLLIKKVIISLLFISLMVFIIYYIKNHIADFMILKDINWTFFMAALVAAFFHLLVQAASLQVVMKGFGVNLKLKKWLSLTILTTFSNYILPFSGLGFRATYLKRVYGLEYTHFITTYVAIIVIELLVYGIGGMIGLAWLLPVTNMYLFFVILTITLICLILLFLNINLPNFNNKLWVKINNLIKSWYLVRKNKKSLIELFFLMIIKFMLSALVFYFAFLSINLQIELLATFIFNYLANLSYFINILPASFGFYEGAVIYSGKMLGFSVSEGLIVSGLNRIVAMLWIFGLAPFMVLSIIKTGKNK